MSIYIYIFSLDDIYMYIYIYIYIYIYVCIISDLLNTQSTQISKKQDDIIYIHIYIYKIIILKTHDIILYIRVILEILWRFRD